MAPTRCTNRIANSRAGRAARLREHRSYLAQIVPRRFGLDEIQRAFELFYTGETGKVVVEQ